MLIICNIVLIKSKTDLKDEYTFLICSYSYHRTKSVKLQMPGLYFFKVGICVWNNQITLKDCILNFRGNFQYYLQWAYGSKLNRTFKSCIYSRPVSYTSCTQVNLRMLSFRYWIKPLLWMCLLYCLVSVERGGCPVRLLEKIKLIKIIIFIWLCLNFGRLEIFKEM